MNEWLKVNYDNNDLQYDFIIRLMANIESILGLTRMIQLVKKQLEQDTQYEKQARYAKQDYNAAQKGGFRKARSGRRARKTRRLVRK